MFLVTRISRYIDILQCTIQKTPPTTASVAMTVAETVTGTKSLYPNSPAILSLVAGYVGVPANILKRIGHRMHFNHFPPKNP